ncbi:MAG: hypothetical protein NT126_00870 [Bacteroidetes bacterium]|nr:hypothetical protein [Bacteroidota bacterium]
MKKLPKAVQVCLWSYDTDKIDISSPEDRFRVILNVLNRGTMEAVKWLWQTYSKDEIRATITHSIASEWNSKSLSFWSRFYNTSPSRVTRFAKSYATSLGYSR